MATTNNPEKGNIKLEAVVDEALPAGSFRLKTKDGKEILGHLSGKMRMYYIKILPGDRVIVEVTPYDEHRGRIVRRL
ncbi:MAG: translation initiation factor IF-1 [Patescibacteria group bacterium]|nr:translation initiation factor IF-1 [Patescibacteria group bacterium]